VKQIPLHLLAALLVAMLLASLPAISSVFIMGYFSPGEIDDVGFSGAAAIVFGVIIYSFGLPKKVYLDMPSCTCIFN
jgi:hypothetical protein